jgi:8-oxo-dGTP pyrophosphatase MutT (NUDIX family)
MPQPWTVLKRTTLLSDAWVRVHAERVRTATGMEIEPWYVVEAADWVTVVPVLPDGRIVLVEQYRHGALRVGRELPAGNIEPGEDPALTAVRELAEETGYQAAQAPIPLGVLWPEPARSRVRAHGYLIRCAAAEGRQQLDATEDIAVVTVSGAEFRDPVACGILHGTQLAFSLLAQRLLHPG